MSLVVKCYPHGRAWTISKMLIDVVLLHRCLECRNASNGVEIWQCVAGSMLKGSLDDLQVVVRYGAAVSALLYSKLYLLEKRPSEYCTNMLAGVFVSIRRIGNDAFSLFVEFGSSPGKRLALRHRVARSYIEKWLFQRRSDRSTRYWSSWLVANRWKRSRANTVDCRHRGLHGVYRASSYSKSSITSSWNLLTSLIDRKRIDELVIYRQPARNSCAPVSAVQTALPCFHSLCACPQSRLHRLASHALWAARSVLRPPPPLSFS